MYHIFSVEVTDGDLRYRNFVDIEGYVPQIGSTLTVHEDLPTMTVINVNFESPISTLRVYCEVNRDFYGSEIETFENEEWNLL